MPVPTPEAVDFLQTRRSRPAKTLRYPAPDRDVLIPILRAGVRVPDHGKLEPWRYVILEGTAPVRIANRAAERARAMGFDEDRVEKTAVMFRMAPLIVTVVASPISSEKIPQGEQILSAGAVCLSVLNAALASGWGANWLTGPLATDAAFLEVLDIHAPEFAAGFIVLGTETSAPPERPRPDLEALTTWIKA